MTGLLLHLHQHTQGFSTGHLALQACHRPKVLIRPSMGSCSR